MDSPAWRRVQVGGSVEAPPVPITVSVHRVACGERVPLASCSRPQAVSPAFLHLRQPSLLRLALESAGVSTSLRRGCTSANQALRAGPQITVAPARLAGLTPDPSPPQRPANPTPPPPLHRRVVIRQPPPDEASPRAVEETLSNSWAKIESSPCKRPRVAPPAEYLECPICMDTFPGEAVELHVAECLAELEEEHRQWREWERAEREAAQSCDAEQEAVETEVEFVVNMDNISFLPDLPLSPMPLPPELVEGTVEFERKKRQRELELKLQMIELYKEQLKEAMLRQQTGSGSQEMTSA